MFHYITILPHQSGGTRSKCLGKKLFAAENQIGAPSVKYRVYADAQETGSYQAGNEVAAQTGLHFPSCFSSCPHRLQETLQQRPF